MQSTALPLRFSIIMVKLVNNSNSNKFIPFLFSIHFIFCCGFYTHKFIAATLICLENFIIALPIEPNCWAEFHSLHRLRLNWHFICFIWKTIIISYSIHVYCLHPYAIELVGKQCASEQLSIDINIIYCYSSIIPLINV